MSTFLFGAACGFVLAFVALAIAGVVSVKMADRSDDYDPYGHD